MEKITEKDIYEIFDYISCIDFLTKNDMKIIMYDFQAKYSFGEMVADEIFELQIEVFKRYQNLSDKTWCLYSDLMYRVNDRNYYLDKMKEFKISISEFIDICNEYDLTITEEKYREYVNGIYQVLGFGVLK